LIFSVKYVGYCYNKYGLYLVLNKVLDPKGEN